MINIVKEFTILNPCTQLTAKKCVEITLNERFVDAKGNSYYSIKVKNLFFQAIDQIKFTIDEYDANDKLVNSTEIRKTAMYIKKKKSWVLFGDFIKVNSPSNQLKITVTKIIFESVGYFRGGIGDIEEPLFELKPGETYIHPKRSTYPNMVIWTLTIITILAILIFIYLYLDIFVH